jgi:hypothetical protein
MNEKELNIHHDALQLIQRDLQFAQANEAAIKDEDDE